MVWRKLSIVTAMIVGAVTTSTSEAQEAYARTEYGKGVHAYHAGRMFEAERHFTDAIQTGTRDPRCYYYRGLTYLRTGQQSNAEGDFRVAAALEVQQRDAYDVGLALTRVQGVERLKLEDVRQETRLAMANMTPAAPAADDEPVTPANRPRQPGVQFQLGDFGQLPDDPTDPFQGDVDEAFEETPPASSASTVSETTGSPDAGDTFGDDTNDLFSAESDNPFGDESGAEAGAASAETGAAMGAFQSIFRSFRNSVPEVNIAPPAIPGMPPGGAMPGGPGAPGEFGPEGFGPDGTFPPAEAFPPGDAFPPTEGGPPGDASFDFGTPDASDPSADAMPPAETPAAGTPGESGDDGAFDFLDDPPDGEELDENPFE